MSIEFIFVYGTLRKDTALNKHYMLEPDCSYYSEATMQGKLYDVDGYPGAILSDNPRDIVYGDVYKITNGAFVFSQLDNYESCSDNYPKPQEYRREKLNISLSNGRKISAWVYLFNHHILNLKQIVSGDYLNMPE